jgi:hypothetical protein
MGEGELRKKPVKTDVIASLHSWQATLAPARTAHLPRTAGAGGAVQVSNLVLIPLPVHVRERLGEGRRS